MPVFDESEPPQNRRRRSVLRLHREPRQAELHRLIPARPHEGAIAPTTARLGQRRPAREVQADGTPIGKRKRDRRVVEHSEPLQPTPAHTPVERLACKGSLTRHPLGREPIRGQHDLEADEMVVEGGDSPDLDSVGPRRLLPRAPSRRRPAPTAARDHASRARAGGRATAAAGPSSRCSRTCSRCLR